MNVPPQTYIRVDHQQMQVFMAKAGRAVGLPGDKADLLAGLLTTNDLRGVVSHGSRWFARHYAADLRSGQINPRPQVRVVSETPVSLLLDGDGGLG